MKDHFIPCLLLSRFAIDGESGRKARVHQLRRSGPHPSRAVAAQDLAHSRDFYQHTDFPGLDSAGLHALEKASARMIADIASGTDPQLHAQGLSAFVRIQASRTKAWRQEVQTRTRQIVEQGLATLGSQQGADAMGDRLAEEVGDGGLEDLINLGLSPAQARLAIHQLGSDHVCKLITGAANSASIASAINLFRQHVDDNAVDQLVAKAQVNALHTLVASADRDLQSLRWVRMEAHGELFILGDSCVVALGADGAIGWPFKFGREVREVYLPIDKRVAIVGLAGDGRDAPTLVSSNLNDASAGLARKYIYAPRCTQRELDLASQIGSIDPLTTDDEAADLASGMLQTNPLLEPDAQPPARRPTKVGRNSPCPCGSGRKFKRCCGRQ